MPLPEQFRQYLRRKNLNPRSIRCYVSDLRYFLRWWDGGKDIGLVEVDKGIIVEYKDWLQEQGVPASTVIRRISSLRRFK